MFEYPDSSSNKPFDVFLIGDTGAMSRTKTEPVLQMMRKHMDESANSAVIFLGDNIYPRGLPPVGNILRKDAEAALKKYHSLLEGYTGKVVFISGNHDWNKGRANGYEYVIRQEEYLQNLFQNQSIFLPRNGCPGPEEIIINDKLTIVLINTQWWMQPTMRPIGREFGCKASSEEKFFELLEDIFDKNRNKRVLVAGHAPVYSYAIHGGSFKLKHHLFPFTLYHRKAYVPVPVIGSLVPLYRKYFGAREDIAHPRYRRLRHKLKYLFKKYPGIIYAAGHEHNLQYITKDGGHFIISGAGSKLKYVIEEGKNLRFGLKAKGFFKLSFYDNGRTDTEVWAVDWNNPYGKQMYNNQILTPFSEQ